MHGYLLGVAHTSYPNWFWMPWDGDVFGNLFLVLRPSSLPRPRAGLLSPLHSASGQAWERSDGHRETYCDQTRRHGPRLTDSCRPQVRRRPPRPLDPPREDLGVVIPGGKAADG